MTYDNTDERGEDAVARQRGGSERPQHVDTCRVYNCYGCEEIADEPGHLPECEPDLQLSDGSFIACICDRLRACEARVFVDRTDHWNAALDAARDAVAALLGKTVPPSDGVTEALAAIESLKATP